MASMDDFRTALNDIFRAAQAAGRSHVDVLSRDLHDQVMGQEQPNRMPMACNAMHAAVRSGDQILETSRSGQTTRLRIRYRLPR